MKIGEIWGTMALCLEKGREPLRNSKLELFFKLGAKWSNNAQIGNNIFFKQNYILTNKFLAGKSEFSNKVLENSKLNTEILVSKGL